MSPRPKARTPTDEPNTLRANPAIQQRASTARLRRRRYRLPGPCTRPISGIEGIGTSPLGPDVTLVRSGQRSPGPLSVNSGPPVCIRATAVATGHHRNPVGPAVGPADRLTDICEPLLRPGGRSPADRGPGAGLRAGGANPGSDPRTDPRRNTQTARHSPRTRINMAQQNINALRQDDQRSCATMTSTSR